MQQVGLIFRHKNAVRFHRVGNGERLTINKMAAQKRPVETLVDAFQDNRLNVVLRLHDARFEHVWLNVSNTVDGAYLAHWYVVGVNRLRLERVVGVEIRNLHIGTETCHLRTDHIAETCDNGHTQNHHGQAQSNARNRNVDNRPSERAPVLAVESDAVCYEKFGFQNHPFNGQM